MKISVPTLLFLLFVLLVLAVVTAPGQSPAPRDEEIESFVPTERLPADSAISFPVDI